MLRRDATLLRGEFRRLLTLGLSIPLLQACSHTGGAAPNDGGATDATTVGLDGDGNADDTGSVQDTWSPPFRDAGQPDALVTWCDAGPPQILPGGTSCETFVKSPCGLPDGVVPFQGGLLTVVLCQIICSDAGALNGCFVYGYAEGGAPDGGGGGDAGDGGDAAIVVPDAGGEMLIECMQCQSGRRPAGARFGRARAQGPVARFLANASALEAASVIAFEGVRDTLSTLGAPRLLVAAADRARRDEVRHARVMARLARSHGACPVPFDAPKAREHAASLEAFAIENAVEGCVRETYGALAASWQARRASDPRIKDAMRQIAVDETRHAALGWSIHRWAHTRLRACERARVRDAMAAAAEQLAADAAQRVPSGLMTRAGLPPRPVARAFVSELRRTLWR